jgi:F0F1-type ATP synthase alpha subunit
MAELTISAADIASALKKNLEGFEPSIEARTVGRVAEVGDGIARINGLPDAAVNELLEFEDGSVGLALNLDEESIGAVVISSACRPVAWRSRRRASWAASRCTSRCRPGSSRSTR